MASESPHEQPAEDGGSDEELQSEQDAEPSSARLSLIVTEEPGDLFNAPPWSIIVHACNCNASWGAGIALQFKRRYPEAYKIYVAHCKKHSPSDLVGTALIIPPSETSGTAHYIGCLFTSKMYGARKDAADDILGATRTSMKALLGAIDDDSRIGGIYMCMINSGRFGVPWFRTKRLLEELEVNFGSTRDIIRVLYPGPFRTHAHQRMAASVESAPMPVIRGADF
jgi:ADP-ribose 1''-phosphate phosphatase